MDPNQNFPNQPMTPPQPQDGSMPPQSGAPVGQPGFSPQPPVQPMTAPPVYGAPTPGQSIAPQPMPVYSMEQPQPGMPQAPQPPIMSAPGPQVFGGMPMQPAGQKFPVKLIAIIVGAIVGVAALAGIGWFVYTTFFNTIALKTYDGDTYSILVPEEYKQDKDSFGDGVTFKEDDEDKDTQSAESISSLDISSLGDRDKVIAQIDKSLDEDKVAENLKGSDDDATIKDYKLTKTKIDGQDARKITATAMKDGKKTGSLYMVVVYGEKNFYYVIIAAHESDQGFKNAAEKIISSFKIK